MSLDKGVSLQFYQNLGKIFYAIAVADHVVRDEEYTTVIHLVETYWLPEDSVLLSSKSDEKNAIIDTFKWLYEHKEEDADECYKSFISFKKSNPSIFTKNINALILKTVGKIAMSFSGLNKSELILLAKLDFELRK
ncbi:hypothetical protein [Winogradskyella ludwigii]|uniref:hypothetical protein n=1 Tax=Winogradskyella ludwigii TaxID=2686076 RepID=UPI0015C7F66F|nr:hypothetical protein [Winogradskyella ludwigii]